MLIRLGGAAFVIGLILWLIALAESITADETRVRNLPKLGWILLILITFDIGAILWFVLGRPVGPARDLPYKGNTGLPQEPQRQRRTRPPVGPDDDPGFLDSLDNQRLSSWEEDLLRRERELRDRDEDPPA